MTAIQEHIAAIRKTLNADVTLICVSKFNPTEAIEEAYAIGERDFGESHVQELLQKHETLPKDIRWHMIGHLQTNKVRAIVPFIHLIQSVDSVRLIETIEKEAARIDRTVNILLEVHVAKDESKSGFAPEELPEAMEVLRKMPHIRVLGFMGMSTLTDDETEIRRCFRELKSIANTYASQIKEPSTENPEPSTDNREPKTVLSMGMSGDYRLAIEEGSTMVRIGSTIFGERDYSKH